MYTSTLAIECLTKNLVVHVWILNHGQKVKERLWNPKRYKKIKLFIILSQFLFLIKKLFLISYLLKNITSLCKQYSKLIII